MSESIPIEAELSESQTAKVGRPLKFESVEDLEVQINLYFDYCDKEYDIRKYSHDEIDQDDQGKQFCLNCYQKLPSKGCLLVSGEEKKKKPYTVTGLALWLDTTRRTLLDYQARDEFSHTITRAKLRIENYASEALFDSAVPTKGVTFSLANNHEGWKEKTENETTIKHDPAAQLLQSIMGTSEEHKTI